MCRSLSSLPPNPHPPASSPSSSSPLPVQDDSSVSSEDMNAAEPAWVAAEQPPVPEPSPPNGDAVGNPAPAVKEEDGEAARSRTCSIIFFIYMWEGERPRVQIGVMQETACLILSALIQINPLLLGVGHRCSPNPRPRTPLFQGAWLREVGQKPILTFTA